MRPLDVAYASSLNRQQLDITWMTSDEVGFGDGCKVESTFRGIYDSSSVFKRGFLYCKALIHIVCRARHVKGPVVVHQQFTIVPSLDFVFACALRAFKIPLVFDPHDIIPFSYTNPKFLKLLYLQSSALIVHSLYARRQLISFMGKDMPPTYYVPLGHENEYYKDECIRADQARESLGIKPEDRVILFAGQIKKEKGLEYLLRALPLIRSRVPNVKLLIAGRPFHQKIDTYEELINKVGVQQQVIAKWGYINESDLILLHQAADVVALPYLHVYQSASCITAYAFKLPVVVFNTGGLAEQVRNGDTGYIVPAQNVEALAGALGDLLSDRRKAAIMGEKGYQWIAKEGDWDIIAAKTAEIYHKVVGIS